MTELPPNSKVTGSGRLVRISLVIGNLIAELLCYFKITLGLWFNLWCMELKLFLKLLIAYIL